MLRDGYERGEHMERIDIRPSTIQSIMLCPARTMLRGHDNFDPVPSEGLAFGSMEHWCIEQVLTGKGTPSFDACLLALDEILLRDVPEKSRAEVGADLDRLISGKQRRNLIVEALDALDEWRKWVLPDLPTKGEMHVERPRERLVAATGDVEVWLIGTPDLVFPGESMVYDWKTAGMAWKAEKYQQQIQPIAYRYLTGA